MIEKIEIKNLSHQYNESRKVFDGLNAELPLHEIAFFDGGVGSGRSTLLRMIAGLLMPKSGSIVFNDQEVSEMSFEEFLPTRLRIGYSFEYAGLLNNRSLRENLLLPARYHSLVSADQARARVEHLLEVFGLSEVANERPSAVSGSQRKACVVARAFVMEPELVLLDEPFAGLGSGTIEVVKRFIDEERKQGKLKHVFLTCQSPREVEGWATQKVFVEATKVTCESLARRPSAKGAA